MSEYLINTLPCDGSLTTDEPELNEKSAVITFGMFPQLQDITKDDFKAVEWRGEDDDFFDTQALVCSSCKS